MNTIFNTLNDEIKQSIEEEITSYLENMADYDYMDFLNDYFDCDIREMDCLEDLLDNYSLADILDMAKDSGFSVNHSYYTCHDYDLISYYDLEDCMPYYEVAERIIADLTNNDGGRFGGIDWIDEIIDRFEPMEITLSEDERLTMISALTLFRSEHSSHPFCNQSVDILLGKLENRI